MSNFDPYKILGVSEESSDEEIKKAHRKLVLEFHPDRNQSPEAENKMKEINAAYDMISTQEKREKLRFQSQGQPDFGGFPFEMFQQFFGRDMFGFERHVVQQKDDYEVPVEDIKISLKDAVCGVKINKNIKVSVTCNTCSGSGEDKNSKTETSCSLCGGTGKFSPHGVMIMNGRQIFMPCSKCRGNGKIKGQCNTCSGKGRNIENKQIDINVPPGMKDGDMVEIGQQPHIEGALRFHIECPPNYILEPNGTVSTQINVTYPELLLGTTIDVLLPNGNMSKTKIPGGMDPFKQTVRLRDQGAPTHPNSSRRGDFLLHLNLIIPNSQHLTNEQKNLLERLQKTFTNE